jgi:DNA-binding response OmpR family regulator
MSLESNIEKPQTLKVLVADDDAPTRILLRAAISQWGYEVIEAKDGEHAWELLHTGEPARLLILDWLMPKLDGISLCERIKKEFTSQPYTYIILLTQLSGTTNIVKGLEAGADEFLSKPFNMAELRSRLFVGARIVTYERQIALQEDKLKKCISQQQTNNAFVNELETSCTKLLNHSQATNSDATVITEMNKLLKLIEDHKQKQDNNG